MKELIKAKIKEIRDNLSDLYSFLPKNFGQYAQDIKTKAACERYFEKVVEGTIDCALLVIKSEKLKIPEDDLGVFDALWENGIISQETNKNLKAAKKMRNLITHYYGKVDDHIVYETLNEELKRDIIKFLKEIETFGGK